MALTIESVMGWVSWLRGDLLTIREAFRARGAKFFIRPLGLGGVIVFCAYFYVFRASTRLRAKVERDLIAAEATAMYSDEYKNLKMRLDTIFARLPTTEDPENWLLQAIRKSLREEGIVPLSTSAAKETLAESYRFVSIDLECQASYQQIGSWISRLERGAELLFIQSLEMEKDPEKIGLNKVTVTITTVSAKKK